MSSWRDRILREFTPKVARLTLVADPDGLMLEEGVLTGIRERGYDLLTFEDHIAFRYAYESLFRSRWDRGEHTDLVVVLRSQASDLGSLPFDLLQAGRRLSFNLGDIFPDLSYPVLTLLDRSDLDVLSEALIRHVPGKLGNNATKEFVLRHIYAIAPELIKQPSDLLRVLIRRHYLGQRIPKVLDERFIELLHQNAHFDGWPLESLVTDREAFFSFLQERWPLFLDREAGKELSFNYEFGKPYGLALEGPVDLPFDHHDVRIYIDNLFTEGLLRSVPHEHAETLSKTWLGIGIQTAPLADRSRKLNRLTESLRSSIPSGDARHTEWFVYARGWAELIVLLHEQSGTIAGEFMEQAKDLQSRVDAAFTCWLLKRYAGLANLPPVPPVMLHHLPRFLARLAENNRQMKIALIMVDGLSLDQWLVVRSKLASKMPALQFRDQAVFAWIPTLTSVSRQAAFAGKAPFLFPDSIHATTKEPALWLQFWTDHGYAAKEVAYVKGLGDDSLESVSEVLSHPQVMIAGLVVDKVDKIMHGMEMGTAGMHNQVAQWAGQPFLSDLLTLLLDRGFQIHLTSDHGNIEAAGCGSPAEGAIADLRGVRVRVYPDASLRRKTKEQFPDALEWNPVGLPEDYLSLLAPPRQAFVQQKERIICHGGASLEELIVPLVQIELPARSTHAGRGGA